jgi:tetratricopeptide (TPR) repeat protein
MATLSSVGAAKSDAAFQFDPFQIATRLILAAALVYAFLAGLHTMQDFDLGWQLATGRWVVLHHRVFSTDVFSYTALGQPWIYPALSGVIFYLTFLVGGYALLSWMGAGASCGATALLMRKNALAGTVLALLAVSLIANRTQPRAEMFTTVLFAAFLALLWRQHRGNQARLWVLPVLMVLWVNLHPGFVAGLGLCAGYVMLEALELPFASRRRPAVDRIRRAGPWLGATAVATLVNPWGPYIYLTIVRQQKALAVHSAWIVEWESVRLGRASLQQGLDWRDPQSSFWWLLVAVAVGIGVALWRRQIGAAIFLAGSTCLGMQHVRLQALFACVAVVVAGSLVDDVLRERQPTRMEKPPSLRQARGRLPHAKNVRELGHPSWYRRLTGAAIVLLTASLLSLAFVRAADLVSNRYYMRSSQLSVFGGGLSWWYPERAVDFIEREKLPANIFDGYTLGGYLTWRLFPAYRDYIDSRALPFGKELFFRGYDLATEPPTAEAWRREADALGINTIIVPLARYQGMTLFPSLHAFCRNQLWRPVYLDDVSAIFLRATQQNKAWIDRLQIDCDRIWLAPSPAAVQPVSARQEVALFNYYANAGGVLYSLERYPEALADLDRAQSISQDNTSVHLFRALVLQQLGRAAEAETEFRTSLALEPTEEGWFDFGLFYMTQRRYGEAADIFRRSAETSSRPHELWMMLGQAYVQSRQPEAALGAFDKAAEASPFRESDGSIGARFNSLIAAGRANAWYQLGDIAQAVNFQEEAVKLAPEDPALWQGLADVYEVQGRATKAAEARAHAVGLR